MARSENYISIPLDEDGLRMRNRVLSVLLDMSSFLSGDWSLQELLNGALSRLMEVLRFDGGRIYRVERESGSLRLVAFKGLEPTGLENMAMGEGFSGRSAESRSFLAQRVDELEDWERANLLSQKGFKIIVCVPMLVGHDVVGVMNLASRREIGLNQEDVDLMVAMANQIAVAASRVETYQGLLAGLEEIKQKNETIKFMTYSASHDLKSPATAVLGLARLLRKRYAETLAEADRQICLQIEKAAEQMIRLLDDLNAYAKSKESTLKYEVCPMTEVFETIAQEFDSVLKGKKVRFEVPAELPAIVADKIAVLRIFRNLTDNALKYGGPDLRNVVVRYNEDKDAHIFSVVDDGVGLSREGMELIFEPFRRYETSKGTEGTGLGLAIVQELAKRHQGTLAVSSDPGKGATFRVTFSKTLIPS